jgi:hypothetical protein
MNRAPSVFRTAAKLVFCLLLVLSAGASPARAQIMHNDGVALPWFHTRAEKLERQACEDNLPECRDSVRQQLAVEHMVTILAPWILLCLVMLGAVMYVRRRDAARERQRHQAERQHVQTSRRPRGGRGDAGEQENAFDKPAADDENLGLGHPGDR